MRSPRRTRSAGPSGNGRGRSVCRWRRSPRWPRRCCGCSRPPGDGGWKARIGCVRPSRRAAMPFIAFWHGRIVHGVFHLRGRGIVVIISENFDGEWIARIIHRLGYGTARGSSSRGARKALRQMVRESKAHPTAFTVDGPRGPAESLSRVRSGCRRPPATRWCRSTPKPRSIGRCAAGTAPRFRSRSPPWRSSSANPSSSPLTPTSPSSERWPPPGSNRNSAACESRCHELLRRHRPITR